ncbi:MAG TPA: hypothetical protein VFV41_06975, partial [Streptosporangiaceae bacterium]|nr:hypothetical protein [Streptosporangiaceae bacterium]
MSSQVTEMPALMRPDDIGALRQAGDPRVSPDGRTVAFTVTDPDLAANRYTSRIWLAAAGTGAAAAGTGAAAGAGGARPLTGPGAELLPRWS